LLLSDGHALLGLHLQAGRKAVLVGEARRRSEEPFEHVRAQLEEYFAGRRSSFELTLGLQEHRFNAASGAHCRRSPYGETLTYGGLAQRIDQPTAGRAVGRLRQTPAESAEGHGCLAWSSTTLTGPHRSERHPSLTRSASTPVLPTPVAARSACL